ncbi:proteasome subunit alpha type-4-like [Tripterygium wilfordii]|uniref:Proteasome subunit alpha type-4-like n=1 Tax=Tripterygium wilfordii TaxID=458696 RepID=A0A7J7D7W9_TRIWF|nr:proteasome subunit alpha type-4-like [Tripterygium wilfordii]
MADTEDWGAEAYSSVEAIGNAGTAIAMLSKDGLVLVGEKKVNSKFLRTAKSTQKMYKNDDHGSLCCGGYNV